MNSIQTQKGKAVYSALSNSIVYVPYTHCDVCEGNIYEQGVFTCSGCEEWLASAN